jgi:hypothetical protein
MCAADAAAGLLRYARNDGNTPLLAAGLFNSEGIVIVNKKIDCFEYFNKTLIILRL